MTNPEVADYVTGRVSEARQGADLMSEVDVQRALVALMPEKVYPGEKEADIADWIFTRVMDAKKNAFPRETIQLGNRGISAPARFDRGYRRLPGLANRPGGHP